VLKLVGEQEFDRSYVSYIKGLAPGWGFTSIRYFLNRPVMDVAMYVAYSSAKTPEQVARIGVEAGAEYDTGTSLPMSLHTVTFVG
jgi:hypothetical protein